LVLLTGASPGGRGCGMRNLSIAPVEKTEFERYAGSGRKVQVEFRNERRGADVEVFPEPPLVVRDRQRRKSCEIDGGNWARSGVFLSNDERHLLLLEFSGSNEALVLYDTATCRRLQEIDVSAGRWRVEPSRVVVGQGCSSRDINSCRSMFSVALGPSCQAGARKPIVSSQ
jgi:hypothetical protein